MANALAVAEYIVNFCNDNHFPISNLKLQKVLYFLWIDYYTETKQRLFNDPFKAWAYGPVVISVYNRYSAYGSLPIRPVFPNSAFFGNSQFEKDLVDRIIKEYFKQPASFLVNKSHRPNGAWDCIYNKTLHGKEGRSEIPFDLIIEREVNGRNR